MTFTPRLWRDYPNTPLTAITAEHLNRIENGINALTLGTLVVSGTDLNTLVDTGHYRSNRWSTTSSLINRPDVVANPMILYVYDNNDGMVVQDYQTVTSGIVYRFRRYKSSSGEWFPWHEESSLIGGSTALTSGQDLDNLLDPGDYHSTTSTITQTIVNKPAVPYYVHPFTMTVWTGATGHVYQEVRYIDAGLINTYQRYNVPSSGWNAWELAYSTERDPTRTSLVLYGDSHLDEGTVSGVLTDEFASTATVTNRARGGHTIDLVSLRAGTLSLWFEVVGGEIPASGTVQLHTDKYVDTGRVSSFTVYLEGVYGTITFAPETRTWSFTRSGTGAAVPIVGKVQAISTLRFGKDDSMIFWCGGNNSWETGEYIEKDRATHVIAGYQKFMASVPDPTRVLLPGVTMGDAVPGDERYDIATKTNEWLETHYPMSYCGVNEWLIENGNEASNIPDTQADLDARAQGLMPPSLLADSVHFRTEVLEAIGHYFKTQLTSRGIL